MSSEDEPNREEEDEQFNQAFGEHTGISKSCSGDINDIKNNDPDETELILNSSDVERFTDLSWRLLGRYIANNIHLEALVLSCCRLTDENMALLFRELPSSSSISALDMRMNDFGIEGVRCMLPFFENTPNLSNIEFSRNNINSEGFELLVNTLHRVSSKVKTIDLCYCNIIDISALDTYNLPNLQSLTLDGNKIGRDGCRILSSVLQKEDTSLKYLYLRYTDIDDEGAEALAGSLLNNTMLRTLILAVTKRGFKAFLKLLADVSSIENTYNSNHTLTNLSVPQNTNDEIYRQINSTLQINKYSQDSRRAKVVKYQLNSQKRKELCQLQGINYSSEDNMLAGVEPKLLPKILALIGEKNGQSDFYTSLLPVAPDLMSFIDRKAMLKDERARKAVQMKELTRQLAVLAAEDDQLNKRLALIELGDSKQAAVVDRGKEGDGGEKRQRMS